MEKNGTINVVLTCPNCSKKVMTKISANIREESWQSFFYKCPNCKESNYISKNQILEENANVIATIID